MFDGSTAPGGSLVRRAMDMVSGHIRDHRLKVGDSLPGEAHFAGSLGVSRAVMREAFGALAALRLIDVANGRRPRVGAIDGSVIATSLDHAISTSQISVADVWEVRRTIELRTAVLAAQNRSDADAEQIGSLADAMAQDGDDLDAMTRHDIAFHTAIARSSGNALYGQIVDSFGPLMEIAVPEAWRTRTTEAQRRDIIERHHAIARAIHRSDRNAAEAAMADHFDTSIGDMLKAAEAVAL